MKPLLNVKISCTRRSKFYGRLVVCVDERAALEFCRESLGRPIEGGMGAICCMSALRWTRKTGRVTGWKWGKGFDRNRHHLWFVILYVGRLGSRFISHEATHAAVHYVRMRNRLAPIGSLAAFHDMPSGRDLPEEILAAAVGDISKGIVDALYVEGLIK